VISTRQNEQANLHLLAAQRQLYQQAKALLRLQSAGNLGLAAAAPMVALVSTPSGHWLGMIGAIWLLASRWPARPVTLARVRMAADIQEQFDTEVFGLPWNGLKGDRVVPHLRAAAQRRHLARHGDDRLESLRDWYPDPSDLRPPLDILACQGTNSGWNARLYGEYAAVLTGLLIVLVVSGLSVALVAKLLLVDYLVAIVLPSTPAFVEVADSIVACREQATGWAAVDRAITRAWEEETQTPGSLSVARCRAIQDQIWDLRRTGPPIPSWYYDLRRRAHEHDAVSAVAGLRTSAD
jgi:hypothetical protein